MEIATFLNKVKNAKDLDFGEIFSNSIDLFKKTWAQGFLHFLFTLIFTLPLIVIIYAPIITFAIKQEQGYSQEPPSPALIFSTIGIALLVGMVLNTFTVALQAGFFNVIKMIDQNKQATAKDHFVFFKGKYLKKTFVLSLLSMLIAIVATAMCYLPLLYVIVPLSLLTPIFAFNPNLSVSEVVKAGFALGNKKWFITFGLIFISGLLAELVGILLCGIGIFFTLSFVYLPTYHIYKNTIGFEDDDEISQIGILQE